MVLVTSRLSIIFGDRQFSKYLKHFQTHSQSICALWVLRRRDPDKRGKGKRDRNKTEQRPSKGFSISFNRLRQNTFLRVRSCKKLIA